LSTPNRASEVIEARSQAGFLFRDSARQVDVSGRGTRQYQPVLKHVRAMLRTGVMESGQVRREETAAPQRGPPSPQCSARWGVGLVTWRIAGKLGLITLCGTVIPPATAAVPLPYGPFGCEPGGRRRAHHRDVEGEAIDSVPLSAAMSIAAASGIDGTLISDQARADSGGIRIASPAASIRAKATVDGSGRVARVDGWHRAAPRAQHRMDVIRGQLALSGP
jgi:hypothetical protein